MLLVPLFAFTTAIGFSGFGIATAATVGKIDHFNYVTTLVITPLFLVAGTFFPIDQLPPAAQALAQLNPLYHLVELVRARGVRLRAGGPAPLRHPRRVRDRDVAPWREPHGEAADRLMQARGVTLCAVLAAVALAIGGCGGDDDEPADSGATGAQGASGVEGESTDITAEEFLAKLLPEKEIAVEAVIATEPECEGVKVEPSLDPGDLRRGFQG